MFSAILILVGGILVINGTMSIGELVVFNGLVWALNNPIAIDNMIPKKDVKGLVILSIIFVLTIIVTGLCMKFKIRTMSDIGQKVIKNIRSDIFNKLQKLPFLYYDDRPHGKILVRLEHYLPIRGYLFWMRQLQV